MNKYLGIDLGMAKVGIAISDNGYFASPLKTINFQTNQMLITEINNLINEHKITDIIIGFPKNMNNTIGPKGEEAIKFSEELKKNTNININIVLWDERLTTVSALKILSTKKNKQKTQKSKKDEIAASIILQNYLDSLERTK